MLQCPACGARVDGTVVACTACGGPLDGSRTPTLASDETLPPEKSAPVSAEGHKIPGALIAGRYRVVELLGRGGMGEVVRAEDLSLRQMVALKFLAGLAGHARALDGVRAEVRMARRVSHRNVCRVHDLGEADGELFISMEYVDGEDLASLLQRVGRLAGDRALEIARELCAGLSAAHAAGVIHRDLKPANVMLDRQGRVRITDFGLAQLGEEGATAGEIAGTPAYMAPEQLAGAGATVKSDLYALGLVLYELLTGRRAFPSAPTLSELRRLRRETDVVPPGQLVRELDPVVDGTILRCLAARPEERPESALAVLTALSGGDPLKAALAAGQTPSPSAVAAAPVVGVLAPKWAWACAAVVLASLAIFMRLGARLSPIERVRPPFPPAALAVKAEEAMRALGHGGACVDDVSGFAYDDGALRTAASDKGDPARRAEAAVAERRMIVFWHRCSPVALVPWGQTRVTRENPPMGPGESLAELDVNGHLLRYFHPQEEPAAGATREAPEPLAAFFRLAGLESALLAGTPLESGHLTFDVRLDGIVPARVEADVRGSRLVEASVVPPWAPPSRPRPVRPLDPDDVPDLLFLVLSLASLPLAYRNLRAGRGDRQGAGRVGLLVSGGLFAALLLRAHHTWTFAGENNVLEVALGSSLYFGVTAALLYLALEPFVRRVWPERLVSWTRLLAGDVRDPMVARDVLLGTATFFGLTGLALLVLLASRIPLLPTKAGLEPLLGLDRCFAATALAIAVAARLGLVFLLLLLLLRAFGRIRWLAPLAFFAIVAGFLSTILGSVGTLNAVAIPLALAFGVALLLLLVRAGLLAMTATLFFGTISLVFPNATRLTGWTAFCVWWLVGIIILVAGYGLYFSTGGRPFGDRELFER